MRAAVVGMALLCGIAQAAEPKTVTNSIGMVLIELPAGKFTMGSPVDEKWHYPDEEQVAVTLTKPFSLSKTEVTQGQWKKVMGTAPWSTFFHVQIGEDNAASFLGWDDATAFCQRLTEFERRVGRLKANEAYRLPTEAEWEYACRAGTQTAYSFGNDELQLVNYGWHAVNAHNVPGQGYAHKVGMGKPNPWGFYDMHGNVAEWCSDWYDRKIFLGTDPVGPPGGSCRVLRGGAMNMIAGNCRSADRSTCCVPSGNSHPWGFRVARSQSAK